MTMKEDSLKVFNYLKEMNGRVVTAADVANALGFDTKQVNGIFTSAIQKKGLGVRALVLTDEGMSYDPYDEAE